MVPCRRGVSELAQRAYAYVLLCLQILSTEVLPAAGLLVDGDNAILHDVGISGASKMVTDLKNVMQNTEAMKQHGDRAARLIEAEYMESVMFEVLGRTLSELQQSR